MGAPASRSDSPRDQAVLLLLGSESFLVESSLAELRGEMLSVPGSADFDYELIDAEQSSASAIIAGASTLPVLAPRRLVVARYIESLSAQDQSALAAYAKDPNPACLLVLTAVKLDRRRELAAVLSRQGGIVDAAPLPPREVPIWIRRQTRQLGREISEEAADFLADRSGVNLTLLTNEIKKLCAWVSGEKRIELADAVSLCGLPPGHSVFDLIEAITQKRTGDAVRIANTLLGAGDPPLRLLAFLVSQFRKLAAARELISQEGKEKSLASELGVSPYAAGKIAAQAKRYRRDELLWGIQRMIETDSGLKSGLPPRLGIETLVIDLCLGEASGLRRFLGGERLLYLERQA